MKSKGTLSLLREAWQEWNKDKADRLGAALAYYSIFSIGPVLVLLIAIVGFILGEAAARGQIVERIEGAVGPEAAALIEEMVKAASNPGAGTFAAIFGIVGLILGVIGIFAQLKGALNTLWGVEPPKAGIWAAIKSNIWPFVIVVAIGLLLIASFLVSAMLGAIDNWTGGAIPGGPLLWQGVNYVVMLGVLTVMFALIYRFLPDVHIRWRDVWLGAAITAVLFMLGQLAISLYLSLANVGSPFGAASSLVLILVWIYYSAQIVFYGAELTKINADRHGRPPPEKGARTLTDEERSRQGLPPRRAELKPSPWFK